MIIKNFELWNDKIWIMKWHFWNFNNWEMLHDNCEIGEWYLCLAKMVIMKRHFLKLKQFRKVIRNLINWNLRSQKDNQKILETIIISSPSSNWHKMITSPCSNRYKRMSYVILLSSSEVEIKWEIEIKSEWHGYKWI